MKAWLTYGAFGWLTFIGVAHFVADVASQWLRGKRPPSVETTLYYGLNTAFALGQTVFGLLCLWLASRDSDVLGSWKVAGIALLAATGWIVIAFGFTEYWEPKANTVIFAILLTTAIIEQRA